jgi:hypothetical protein
MVLVFGWPKRPSGPHGRQPRYGSLNAQQAHRLCDRDAAVISSYQPNPSREIITKLFLYCYTQKKSHNSYLVRLYSYILVVVVGQISHWPVEGIGPSAPVLRGLAIVLFSKVAPVGALRLRFIPDR